MAKTHDKLPENDFPGVVYQVPCDGCYKIYTGETGKSFNTRLKAHKAAKSTGSGELIEHRRDTGHSTAFDKAKVVARAHDGGPGGPRWVMEGLFTMLQDQNILNDIDKTCPIPSVYKSLF